MSGNPAPSSAPREVRPPPANPITSSQVEVLLARAASVFGALVGLQTLPALITQFGAMDTAVGLTAIVVMFGSLALAGLAATFRQWTAATFAWFAVVYFVVLVLWPVIVPVPLPGNDVPWIYYLCNVATGCAAVAARRSWRLAALYTVATPLLIGYIRTLPSGGGAPFSQAVLDGLYCFFLGSVVLFITVVLRQAAARVDAAQVHALGSYSDAVRQNATETERVQIDALVHDSVLTTLLAAARAHSPEARELATRMARSAMGHLAAAQSSFPAPSAEEALGVLAGRLRLAAAELALPFDVHVRDLRGAAVPQVVAEAVLSAATQAMVNSVNHAGRDGVARALRVAAIPGGVVVVIEDTGRGFDPDAIPRERLGVRTSIIDRMAGVGGSAKVVSHEGAGTRIELLWTSPEDEPALAAGWSA